ncbi:MAG: GNAT family N-acetyltransferase [Planctomycetes bacterium]|nr:GNAT family N-acetyltransferase [Planctomycetota bacterium]
MLFATTDLAREIESAEAALVQACTRATARRRPGIDARLRPVAGGLAALTEAGSPLNKLVGLGFAGLPDESELSELERAFDARGVPVQVELASLGDPELLRWFSRRGYVAMGCENVLGCELRSLRDLAPRAVEVRVALDSELELWSRVLIDGFAAPDAQGVASHEEFPREVLERVLLDVASTEHLVRYLGVLDERVVGAGAFRRTGRFAQLTGAATLREARRRGVQSALLDVRLHDARSRGAELALVVTQPGSKSQENLQRRGFELLYTRVILVREPAV